jgi:hypothetical protein
LILSSMLVVTKLTGEFTSLEEPTDGSDFIRSDRQIEQKEPTRKFKLLIVRSIP